MRSTLHPVFSIVCSIPPSFHLLNHPSFALVLPLRSTTLLLFFLPSSTFFLPASSSLSSLSFPSQSSFLLLTLSPFSSVSPLLPLLFSLLVLHLPSSRLLPNLTC